ncbi:hypothetical protein GF361_03585 [Candidatus Woesearchaeota archaeon]|nr:hypothetical protein [Candidatus Woesearchaeota archaeon]
MPQAAAHILIPLILMSLFRDFYIKKYKKNFPLTYVLIAGIAGIIPDLDVAAFWILHFFGFTMEQVHRTFAHTIFVPLVFFAFFIILKNANLSVLANHKLKLNLVFLMLAIGSFIHLVLDATLAGSIIPLYPFSNLSIGINLFGYLPEALMKIAAPSLDAGLLIIWLIYLKATGKISDFI